MSQVRVGHEEFGPIAPIYDRLMNSVPYRMWVGYYLLLLSTLEVKPKRLLDVCCGTGTLAELLAAEGFTVEGFDLSPTMIEVAREKSISSMRNLRFEVMDASTFDMAKSYEGAYSFFDSLNYIVDPIRLQGALHRVCEHLEPGGSFVFDMNTAYAFEQDMFTQRSLKSTAKVRYDWKGNWDPANRTIRVDMEFWCDDRHWTEVHLQRAYDESEVREMLAQAGFDRVETYHSYTLDKPRKKSDRIHYACLKRSS